MAEAGLFIGWGEPVTGRAKGLVFAGSTHTAPLTLHLEAEGLSRLGGGEGREAGFLECDQAAGEL